MLEHLKKKDLRNSLQMLESSHRNSLQFGTTVLKKVEYSRQKVEERRKMIEIEEHRSRGKWREGGGSLTNQPTLCVYAPVTVPILVLSHILTVLWLVSTYVLQKDNTPTPTIWTKLF